VKEETGLVVDKANYLFSLPNTYEYSGFTVHTLDMFFECYVKDVSYITAQDDIADAFWMPLNNIRPEEFGLSSVRKGIKKYLEWILK